MIPQTVDEFSYRWRSSYIGVKLHNKILPFYIYEVNDTYVIGDVFYRDDVERNEYEWPNHRLVFSHPEMGYFNSQRGRERDAVLITRPYHQQTPRGGAVYKRGLQFDNLVCRDKTGATLRGVSDIIGVYDIYNPTYPSLDAAVDLITEKYATLVAINLQYALAYVPGYNELILHYYGQPIGVYKEEVLCLPMKYDHHEQNLRYLDFPARLNCDASI